MPEKMQQSGRGIPNIDQLVTQVLGNQHQQSHFSDAFSPPPLKGQVVADPYKRLASTPFGTATAHQLGSPEAAIEAISTLGVEFLLGSASLSGQFGKRLEPDHDPPLRVLVVGGRGTRPPCLLILDPNVKPEETKRITDEGLFHHSLMETIALRSRVPDLPLDTVSVAKEALSAGTDALQQIWWISRPEVIVTSKPEMVALCVPSSCIEVSAALSSTVGVFCRDAAGALGVTACHHGTGGVGTPVDVGHDHLRVDDANIIQDIVFIKVPSNYSLPSLKQINGVLSQKVPSTYSQATFDGLTSGSVSTRITSFDAGLLQLSPMKQLRVQTPADTNTGDSGAALLSSNNEVIGFAFYRSAYGAFPQFSDWIWADNALKALGLTPI
ncbi:MAG: hypothetical protein WAW96_16835 [Alphaproteobacteria bacterium]